MLCFFLNIPSYLVISRHCPGDHAGSSVEVETIEVSPYWIAFKFPIGNGLRLLSLGLLSSQALFNPGIELQTSLVVGFTL